MYLREPLSHSFDERWPVAVCEGRVIGLSPLYFCVYSFENTLDIVTKPCFECIGALGEIEEDSLSWFPHPLE